MNEAQTKGVISVLKDMLNDLETRPEHVKWVSFSLNYTSGGTITFRSADAPKRDRS